MNEQLDDENPAAAKTVFFDRFDEREVCPELDALTAEVAAKIADYIPTKDVRLVIDEAFYRIARRLAHNGEAYLPALGLAKLQKSRLGGDLFAIIALDPEFSPNGAPS